MQELIGYLDAHVPAGENDVRYAEECWNEIVVRYRIVGEDVDLVLRSLREEDAFSHLPEAFYDLALAALRVLPCRRLAGHSRASLEAPQGGCE